MIQDCQHCLKYPEPAQWVATPATGEPVYFCDYHVVRGLRAATKGGQAAPVAPYNAYAAR